MELARIEAVDFTPFLAEMRDAVASGHRLLAHRRLVVCMGSRLALTLFVSANPPEHQIVGAVTTQEEALAVLRREKGDLLLCTDRLERGNGGDLVAAAKRLNPAPNTLMIVTQPRRLVAIRTALEASCDGLCLESHIGQGTVRRAIEIVSSGAIYVEQGLNQQYFRAYAGLEDVPLARLSPRQLDVLSLMAAGTPNREIAAALFLSPETVKTHVSEILRKLPARDRAHAAVKGIRLGLVEWPEDR